MALPFLSFVINEKTLLLVTYLNLNLMSEGNSLRLAVGGSAVSGISFASFLPIDTK